MDLANADHRVLAAVAIHPNDAPALAASGELQHQFDELSVLAADPRVAAVGETGLDFYRTGEDGRAAQFESFEAHIAIAKHRGRALQIHDRDAHDAVVETLLRVGAPEQTVFHCFSGDAELARICNEQGWKMSFAGPVTFTNAPQLREALQVADPSLVLVETDSPFLTPAPFRGRPNAPYMLPVTVRFMAGLLGRELDEWCAQLTANTHATYGSWDDRA